MVLQLIKVTDWNIDVEDLYSLLFLCIQLFYIDSATLLGPTLLLTSDIIRERLGASALDRSV